jgi:alpha/beta superfamily hydrolase
VAEPVEVLVPSDAGEIRCLWHDAVGGAAVIMVGGFNGGYDGPDSMYPDLADALSKQGISALRLHYRVITMPGIVEECSFDVQAACRWLADAHQVIAIGMVGHSFGGAVVIDAAARAENVRAVVTLATQNAGTEMAAFVSPAALLVLHGNADDRLPVACSLDVFARAAQPKHIKVLEGATHSLRPARAEVLALTSQWLVSYLCEEP